MAALSSIEGYCPIISYLKIVNFFIFITGSRQGKIAECLSDFHQNILFGKGFQVDRTTKSRFESGQVSIFSASIEKGLLPLMVLGETGIFGAIAFVIFLAVFFITCHQRHYTATLTLFCVYLSTNLAEATFFAPAGGGGVQWILMVVGGFVIDMNREAERLAETAVDTSQASPPPLLPMVIDEAERGKDVDMQFAQNARGGEP